MPEAILELEKQRANLVILCRKAASTHTQYTEEENNSSGL